MADASNIILFCRGCQAPRYRSIRAIGTNEKLSPSLFQKCDTEGVEPVEGSPALCYVCQSSCTPIADKGFIAAAEKKSEPVRAPRPAAAPKETETFQAYTDPVTTPTPSQPTYSTVSDVDVLFELTNDEDLKAFHDLPDAYLIVTNRRVVRIKKG